MVAATPIKFSEFLDLLLASLHQLEAHEGAGKYFDLNKLAQMFTEKPPAQWVFDAAKVLESRKLCRCVFTFGAIYAQLTGEGRLYVEEEGGSGIIQKFHQQPTQYLLVGNQNQIVVGAPGGTVQTMMDIEQQRRPVFALLDEIEERLGQEASLTEEEKQDLLSDLQALRNQLKKREPNRNVLAALLEPFSQVASISGLVANLIQMINS